MSSARRKAPAFPRRGQPGPLSPLPKDKTPAERLAELERRAAAAGIQPVDDFDQFLEEVGGTWPAEENLDDFLAWLYQSRQEGRSR